MTYKAYYYLKPSGRAPLEEYLASLRNKLLEAHMKALIDKLIERGGALPYPFIKHVWKKVYELRLAHLGLQHRIFYFIHIAGRIILLDGFTKKTPKIPRRLLKKIQSYYQNYLVYRYEKPY